MARSRTKSNPDSTTRRIPWFYQGSQEFQRRLLVAGVLHLLFISFLFLYFSPLWVAAIASIGIIAYSWLLLSSRRSFHFLSWNLRHRALFLGILTWYLAATFVGAILEATGGGWRFIGWAAFGIGGIVSTGVAGFLAGVKLRRTQVDAFTSMDWPTSNYDVRQDSLAKKDVYDAILESTPTWKVLCYLGLYFLPGPITGLISARVSPGVQSTLAILAGCAATLVFGLFLLVPAIDWWVVRVEEKSRGKRLVLSSSPHSR